MNIEENFNEFYNKFIYENRDTFDEIELSRHKAVEERKLKMIEGKQLKKFGASLNKVFFINTSLLTSLRCIFLLSNLYISLYFFYSGIIFHVISNLKNRTRIEVICFIIVLSLLAVIA